VPKHKGGVNHTCLYSCKLITKFFSKVGKNKHPLAESQWVQITMVAGAGFAQGPTIKKSI